MAVVAIFLFLAEGLLARRMVTSAGFPTSIISDTGIKVDTVEISGWDYRSQEELWNDLKLLSQRENPYHLDLRDLRPEDEILLDSLNFGNLQSIELMDCSFKTINFVNRNACQSIRIYASEVENFKIVLDSNVKQLSLDFAGLENITLQHRDVANRRFSIKHLYLGQPPQALRDSILKYSRELKHLSLWDCRRFDLNLVSKSLVSLHLRSIRRIAGLEGLEQFSELKELRIYGSRPSRKEQFPQEIALPNLEALYLRGLVNNDRLKISCPKLKLLRLTANKLEEIHFENPQNLRYVDFSYNEIHDWTFLADLPDTLSSLFILGNPNYLALKLADLSPQMEYLSLPNEYALNQDLSRFRNLKLLFLATCEGDAVRELSATSPLQELGVWVLCGNQYYLRDLKKGRVSKSGHFL